MAIYRLLENAAFDPARVDVMVAAYNEACRILELSGNRTDQFTEMVAKKIVEIAQEGEADPLVICTQSLHELGISTH